MRAWLAQHWRSFAASLVRFIRAPLANLFSLFVMGVALSLPVGLYVLIDNLQASVFPLASEPQISSFMELDASPAEVAQIETRLKQHPRVRSYRFVSRDQALQQLAQSSGLADALAAFPQNPLPDTFIVSAKDATPRALEALRAEIEQWPRVAHAQLDSAWAQRLDAGLRFGRLLVALLAALLALTFIAVTFNTIRLQVLTQRQEIEVVKLIGGTDAYVRRPFLYFGALQGGVSGVVAWLIVSAGIYLMNRNLGELSLVYASLFRLEYPRLEVTVGLFICALILGWCGAWLAVWRELAALPEGADK